MICRVSVEGFPTQIAGLGPRVSGYDTENVPHANSALSISGLAGSGEDLTGFNEIAVFRAARPD